MNNLKKKNNKQAYEQGYFHTDASLKKLATLKDFENTRRKYVWDGNNGDKWEIVERFGYPLTFIRVKNLHQNMDAIFRVNSIGTIGNNNYFPLQ